jgi:hypothetical protein
MVHPCRSRADTGGNPRYKMHNCESEQATETICGLPIEEVDRVHGYTSLCPVCWPWPDAWEGEVPPEEPWTEDSGREGDVISSRREGEEPGKR